jgi:hypothetical protein
MNTYKLLSLIAVSSLTFSVAQAQFVMGNQLLPSQPVKQLGNGPSTSTGTILKKDIRWESDIPLKKTYGELTEVQKAALRALYSAMPEGDEPPFPVEGMRAIFYPIRNAQRITPSRGEINMVVTVGPDGKASRVESFGSESPKMNEVAQQILLLTRYKPGICSGRPCTMQFRFTQKLGS